MAAHGGKREGQGRPKGRKNNKTLEQQAVLEAFNQRVMRKADELFHAQLTLSLGSIRVFRIDEEELDNGKTKRIHTLVTDADEIKNVLDNEAGQIGENYYFISNVAPDNKAIEAMLNRALGKPIERTEITGKDGKDLIPQDISVKIDKIWGKDE